MTAERIALVLGQDPGHELMALFAAALSELVEVGAPQGDAVEVAERLAELPTWSDPGFYKRAQIAAADLRRPGVERLTIFADNLVPHVLRHDGVLRYDPRLAARIDAGEPLHHGSREEEEIRACAVHACELIAKRLSIPPRTLDNWLWNRGRTLPGRPHLTKTTAY